MPGFIYNGKSTKNVINSSELILASFDSVDSVTGMTRDDVSGESTIAHPITNEYGTTYNNLEIEYGLIKKNKKPFTEAEQQIIETWLTSPKISQDIQIYDCENNITDIYCGKFTETEWKPMSGGFAGLHQELGCVADELELIDPLLTVGGGYDDDGTMNIKSIDTLLLSEYAIKGIQELYRQNKQQQKRIEYLELQLNNK